MATLDDVRKSRPWAASMGDAELLQTLADYQKTPVAKVADAFGYGNDGGLTSQRIGGSVDSYQSNLYGVAEAVTGADWAKRGRQANSTEAAIQASRAKDLGGIDSYKDVDGFGSGMNYLGGIAAQSLPYLFEAGVGGLTGGMSAVAGAGARVGLSRAAMQTAGAVAASYPSAVGDILSNQRDQNGTTNLLSASLLAVPYAGLNALGVEGALARRTGFRSAGKMLDDATGLTGGLARLGATGVRTGLVEGSSETAQEGLNQYGRMAVDPNETFFNERSNDRFKESFVGGAALGGAASAVGGWRRSEQGQLRLDEAERTKAELAAQRAKTLESGGPADVLAPVSYDSDVGLGIVNPINPYDVGGHVSAFRDGQDTTIDDPQSGLFGGGGYEQETEQAPPPRVVNPGMGLNTQPLVDRTTGVGTQSYEGDALKNAQGARFEHTGQPMLRAELGQVETPVTVHEAQLRAAGLNEQADEAAKDHPIYQRILARQKADEAKRVSESQAEAQQVKAEAEAFKTRVKAYGVPTSDMGLRVFSELEKRYGEGGKNDQEAFQNAVNDMAAGKGKSVNKLAEALGLKESAAQTNAATTQAPANTGTTANSQAPQANAATASPPAATGTNAAPAATSAPVPDNAGQNAVEPRKPAVSIGAKRGKGEVGTYKIAGTTLTTKPLHFERLKRVLGLDDEGNIVPGNQMTLEAAGEVEGVGRDTVLKSVQQFLPPIKEVVDANGNVTTAAKTTQQRLTEIMSGPSTIEGRSDISERELNAQDDVGGSTTEGYEGSAPEVEDATPKMADDLTFSGDGNSGMRIARSGAEETNSTGQNKFQIAEQDAYKGGEDNKGDKARADRLDRIGKVTTPTAEQRAEEKRKAAEDLARNEARIEAAAHSMMVRVPKAAYNYVADLYDSLKSTGGPGTATFRELSYTLQQRFVSGLQDLDSEGKQNETTESELQREIEREWESRNTAARDARAEKSAQRSDEKPGTETGLGTVAGEKQSAEQPAKPKLTLKPKAPAPAAETAKAVVVEKPVERVLKPGKEAQAKKYESAIKRYRDFIVCMA